MIVDLTPAKLVRGQLTSKRILKSLNVVLTISIIYCIATQMAIILVPLYAISLKMPPLSLAFLVSLPAVKPEEQGLAAASLDLWHKAVPK